MKKTITPNAENLIPRNPNKNFRYGVTKSMAFNTNIVLYDIDMYRNSKKPDPLLEWVWFDIGKIDYLSEF